MPRPVQQHYVTRGYLEGFLSPGDTHVFVYVRNKAAFFRASPDGIAKRRNYYSIKRDDGSYDDRFEHLLQQHVEDPGLGVLRSLASKNRQLKWEARAQLALLMAIQEMRVPWMRESMEEMYGKFVDQITRVRFQLPGLLERDLEKLKQSNPAAANMTADYLRKGYFGGQFRIEVAPQTSLWMIETMAPMLVEFYALMKWTIYCARGAYFVTSDCPVHRFYGLTHPQVTPFGLADPRVEIRFPLSREKLLVLRHDHAKVHKYAALKAKGRNREAERLRLRTPEIAYGEVGEEGVQQYNAHTMSMAARWVFSPVRDDSIPRLFVGECRNMRYEVQSLEGLGLIKVGTVFPTG